MSSPVYAALRKRYAPPAWRLLEEVRNAAGFSASRTADAIAMSLWPSRGLEVHGFEVKASRNDWIRERDAPEKAEAVSKYCDRWWLVVEAEAIVKDGELPPTWGLLALRGKALVTVREAEKREATPISRHFLAAMLKRASAQIDSMVPRDELNAVVAERVAAELERERVRWARDHNVERMAELERLVADLEKAVGIRVRWANLPNLETAYQLATDAERARFWIAHLERAAEHATSAGAQTSALLERARKELGEK